MDHPPAWLAAMADQRQQTPLRRVQLFQASVDCGDVVECSPAALDQLFDRPLAAWPEQLSGNLPEQRLFVGAKRPLQAADRRISRNRNLEFRISMSAICHQACFGFRISDFGFPKDFGHWITCGVWPI